MLSHRGLPPRPYSPSPTAAPGGGGHREEGRTHNVINQGLHSKQENNHQYYINYRQSLLESGSSGCGGGGGTMSKCYSERETHRYKRFHEDT